MPRHRFVALLALVTTAVTVALLLTTAAVREGGGALLAASVATGLIAVLGLAILVRVVVVVERFRRRR